MYTEEKKSDYMNYVNVQNLTEGDSGDSVVYRKRKKKKKKGEEKNKTLCCVVNASFKEKRWTNLSFIDYS